ALLPLLLPSALKKKSTSVVPLLVVRGPPGWMIESAEAVTEAASAVGDEAATNEGNAVRAAAGPLRSGLVSLEILAHRIGGGIELAAPRPPGPHDRGREFTGRAMGC